MKQVKHCDWSTSNAAWNYYEIIYAGVDLLLTFDKNCLQYTFRSVVLNRCSKEHQGFREPISRGFRWRSRHTLKTQLTHDSWWHAIITCGQFGSVVTLWMQCCHVVSGAIRREVWAQNRNPVLLKWRFYLQCLLARFQFQQFVARCYNSNSGRPYLTGVPWNTIRVICGMRQSQGFPEGQYIHSTHVHGGEIAVTPLCCEVDSDRGRRQNSHESVGDLSMILLAIWPAYALHVLQNLSGRASSRQSRNPDKEYRPGIRWQHASQ